MANALQFELSYFKVVQVLGYIMQTSGM